MRLRFWEKREIFKDKAERLKFHVNAARGHFNSLNFQEAIKHYEKGLEIAKEIGDRREQMRLYAVIGDLHSRLASLNKPTEVNRKVPNLLEAIKHYEKGLEIAKEIGDRRYQLAFYTIIGKSYFELRNFQEAIKHYEKGLEIAKEIGDRREQMRLYAVIGESYAFWEKSSIEAVEYSEKGLEIAKEIGDRALLRALYYNIGLSYYRLGNYEKAVEYSEKGLEIAKAEGDKSLQSWFYLILALGLYTPSLVSADYNILRLEPLQNIRKAVEYSEKGLEIAKEIENKYVEAFLSQVLGVLYLALQQDERTFERAIELMKNSIGTAAGVAGEVGDMFEGRPIEGRIGKGLFHFDFKEIEKMLRNILVTGEQLNESQKAELLSGQIQMYENYRKMVEATGFIGEQFRTNFSLGRVYLEAGKSMEAYHCFKRSIELLEVISDEVMQEKEMIQFYSSITNVLPHYDMILLCLQLKKNDEAFEYIEKSKSRAFLQMLGATPIRPSVEPTDELEKLFDRERNFLVKLRKLQTKHLNESSPSLEPGEIDQILRERDELYSKIRGIDPEYALLRSGEPISFKDVVEKILIEPYSAKNE